MMLDRFFRCLGKDGISELEYAVTHAPATRTEPDSTCRTLDTPTAAASEGGGSGGRHEHRAVSDTAHGGTDVVASEEEEAAAAAERERQRRREERRQIKKELVKQLKQERRRLEKKLRACERVLEAREKKRIQQQRLEEMQLLLENRKKLQKELRKLRCIEQREDLASAMEERRSLRIDTKDPDDINQGYGELQTWTSYQLTSRTMAREQGQVTMRMRELPFGRGTFRVAYYVHVHDASDQIRPLGLASGQICVAKRFLGQKRGQEAFMTDLKVHFMASTLADAFTAALQAKGQCIHMQYIWMRLLHRPDDDDNDDKWLILEQRLPNKFQKWTNNSEHITADADVQAAFSHFTLSYSCKNMELCKEPLLVCDIQGCQHGETVFMLTDPAIHTASGKGYGASNLGAKGLNAFVKAHTCNKHCRMLGLQKLTEQQLKELVSPHAGRAKCS